MLVAVWIESKATNKRTVYSVAGSRANPNGASLFEYKSGVFHSVRVLFHLGYRAGVIRFVKAALFLLFFPIYQRIVPACGVSLGLLEVSLVLTLGGEGRCRRLLRLSPCDFFR